MQYHIKVEEIQITTCHLTLKVIKYRQRIFELLVYVNIGIRLLIVFEQISAVHLDAYGR